MGVANQHVTASAARRAIQSVRRAYREQLNTTNALAERDLSFGHTLVSTMRLYSFARGVLLIALDDHDGFIVNAVLLALLAQLVIPF